MKTQLDIKETSKTKMHSKAHTELNVLVHKKYREVTQIDSIVVVRDGFLNQLQISTIP